MTISLHLHYVKDLDRLRARLAAEMEEWLRQRKLQQPEQVPGAERYVGIKPMTMRQTITADTHDKQSTRSVWGSSGDGKHDARNRARQSLPVVRPDHPHSITAPMINHAFRKLKVHKKDAAAYLKLSPSRISNICNQARPCSDKEARELLAAIWAIHEKNHGN